MMISLVLCSIQPFHEYVCIFTFGNPVFTKRGRKGSGLQKGGFDGCPSESFDKAEQVIWNTTME